ncbi:MAG TPA: hypothetical protein VEG30_03185 [Terriglobales bacterium]|nr:hypothetical protein [Terriglobales bacterium]
MHYRAIGKATCRSCHNVWVIDTDQSEPGFIDAESESAAAERFKLMNRLCPTCLKAGNPVAVEFDTYIHVDRQPLFGTK